MANALPESRDESKEIPMQFREYFLWRSSLLNKIQNEDQNRFTIFMPFDAVSILKTLNKGDNALAASIENFIEMLKVKDLSKDRVIKKVKEFDEYLYGKFDIKARILSEDERHNRVYVKFPSDKKEILDTLPFMFEAEKEGVPQILILTQSPVPCLTMGSLNKSTQD